jgi:hypothetical protein
MNRRVLECRLRRLEGRLAPSIQLGSVVIGIQFIAPGGEMISTLTLVDGRREWWYAPDHEPPDTQEGRGIAGRADAQMPSGEWQNLAVHGRLLGKLGRKQEEAIVALLSTRSIEDAARACDMPARTLYRWLNDPDFDKAYRAARRKAFGQSTARLQYGASAAASTLLKVMLDPATPASTKVRAAECVLAHAAKAIEIEEIDERLTALEKAAASGPPRR